LGQVMPADGGDAEVTLTRFAQAGIDRGQLADDLQREGAESFVKSWNELLASIGSEARLLSMLLTKPFTIHRTGVSASGSAPEHLR
jgi:hypothetical protein